MEGIIDIMGNDVLECKQCQCQEIAVTGIVPEGADTFITYVCRHCGAENKQKVRLTGMGEDGTMQCEIIHDDKDSAILGANSSSILTTDSSPLVL